jgi:hypothetical protein
LHSKLPGSRRLELLPLEKATKLPLRDFKLAECNLAYETKTKPTLAGHLDSGILIDFRMVHQKIGLISFGNLSELSLGLFYRFLDRVKLDRPLFFGNPIIGRWINFLFSFDDLNHTLYKFEGNHLDKISFPFKPFKRMRTCLTQKEIDKSLSGPVNIFLVTGFQRQTKVGNYRRNCFKFLPLPSEEFNSLPYAEFRQIFIHPAV